MDFPSDQPCDAILSLVESFIVCGYYIIILTRSAMVERLVHDSCLLKIVLRFEIV